MMRSIFRNSWPDLNSSRILFMLAFGAAGLGCVAASCFALLLLSGPEPQWTSALGSGTCAQSLALFLAAGLMLPATFREPRAAPRALAWAMWAVAALTGTALLLATLAGQPDSLGLCSLVCAPFVLGPGALAVYYGLKARADSFPVPPFVSQTPPPPVFPPALIVPPPATSEAALPDGLQSFRPLDDSQLASPEAASITAEALSAEPPNQAIESTGTGAPESTANIADGDSKTDSKQKQCPDCGATLDVPSGGGYVFCYQCGSQVNF